MPTIILCRLNAERVCMQYSTVSGSALVIDINDREELQYKPVIALHAQLGQ